MQGFFDTQGRWGIIMKWDQIAEQPCSVARALSVLGDRWTLLILRNAFMGVRRFDDFQRGLGLTRHVLAERLKRLVEHGVLVKKKTKLFRHRRYCLVNFFFQYFFVLSKNGIFDFISCFGN